MDEQLLSVRDLHKVFYIPRRDRLFGRQPLHAVNGISFDLAQGEVLGVVGESGCGKSTLARMVLQLIRPTSGQVIFDGQDLGQLDRSLLRRVRSRMQMVFQDPTGSLNPTMTIGQTVTETLRFHGIGTVQERREKASAMLATVGLDPSHFDRFPHELSGGQNQRVGIARALVIEPRLMVMDEAVSALDVSIQAQILKLLEDLRQKFRIAILFISHDLGIVRRISDRIVVLYLGRIMEIGSAEAVFGNPKHPYTIGLMGAHPAANPGKRHRVLPQMTGDIPSPLAMPPGCPFSTRCDRVQDRCRSTIPELRALPDGRSVSCHLV
jgi:oligopeptide/dipeptide ABC transporter ATP-binding protein